MEQSMHLIKTCRYRNKLSRSVRDFFHLPAKFIFELPPVLTSDRCRRRRRRRRPHRRLRRFFNDVRRNDFSCIDWRQTDVLSTSGDNCVDEIDGNRSTHRQTSSVASFPGSPATTWSGKSSWSVHVDRWAARIPFRSVSPIRGLSFASHASRNKYVFPYLNGCEWKYGSISPQRFCEGVFYFDLLILIFWDSSVNSQPTIIRLFRYQIGFEYSITIKNKRIRNALCWVAESTKASMKSVSLNAVMLVWQV